MTGKLLKIELKRALKNRAAYIAFLVACAINLIHIFHNIIPNLEMWNWTASNLKSDMQYPYFLFQEWICGNSYNLEGFLYFMILPLLAVLPHSLSFYTDKENGYIRQMYIRFSREKYLFAKFAAVFIAGGSVIVVPLILNFAVCAMMFPALYPQQLAGTFINASVLWFHIYETKPILYVGIYLLIDFLFAGLVAALPLFLAFLQKRNLLF